MMDGAGGKVALKTPQGEQLAGLTQAIGLKEARRGVWDSKELVA